MSIFSVISYLIAFLLVPNVNAAEKITVPAGTLVTVRTSGMLNPKTNKSGDTVEFIVIQDVKVNDRVVVKSGALARGQITESKKSGVVGMPAKIGVELQAVKAVDGTMIPIRASKSSEGEDKVVLVVVLTLICLPLILIKGGDAQISAGTSFDALTLGTAEVVVE